MVKQLRHASKTRAIGKKSPTKRGGVTKTRKRIATRTIDVMKAWKQFTIEHLPVRTFSVTDLDLAEYADSAATSLANDYPEAVFTSGRRTVDEQANAMAGNIVKNRNWIKQTYAASAERDSLQDWVDQHPEATTKAEIAAGLAGIMSTWTDVQKVKLSRHFAGLAFDVQPIPNGDKLKNAIKALPHLKKFLDNEGGLVIWHAEFEAA